MAKQRRHRQQRSRGGRRVAQDAGSTISWSLPYGKRNGIVLLIGLLVIAIGYFCMARPPVDGFLSLTLAPILLVIGYCVLIPTALLLKRDGEAAEPREASEET